VRTCMEYDVVIAGAGPVGLMLACELRLAGVSVLVIEKLTDPYLPIKDGVVGGRALNVPSIEAFYRRGLLPALKKAALKWIDGSINGEEFAETDRGPAAAYAAITMQSLETLLGNRAADLQTEIRRGLVLTNFSADKSGVTVYAGGTLVRARWLVGCDGGRSTVRKLAGFAFPGTDPQVCGYSAMVEIAEPGKLALGWQRTTTGAYVNGPMPGRILTVEFDGPPKDRDAPITLAELQTSLRKVSDTDATLTAVHAATRWTDNARQAVTYRLGRVLLAGDAAHVFAELVMPSTWAGSSPQR
jgi:2-polyprenyl-6-methoxyphenol hydroxylase-like FAD-dependent oxidoreductase